MVSNPPLANTVTLGVQDFSRQRDFYQRLGWPVVFESDGFAVFQLRGAVLALFQLDQLARRTRAGRADQRGYPKRGHQSPSTGPVRWMSSPGQRERPAPP